MLNFDADDLQDDLLSLAEKIRDKGFLDEAAELETKYFQFKRAETHLYRAFDEDGEDLINRAHPDGDNAICDAQNGLGAVETLLSNQKKIHEMVKKNPTGKYAEEIKSLIEITAEVLGTPLTKKALDPVGDDAEKTPEQLISEQDEKNAAALLTPDTLEKIDAANKLIRDAWIEVPKRVEAAVKSLPEPEFNADILLKGGGVEKYFELLDASNDLKTEYNQLKKTVELFGENIGSESQIQSVLGSKLEDPNSAYSFVYSFAPWLANHRFKGGIARNARPIGDTGANNAALQGENRLSVYQIEWDSKNASKTYITIHSANLAQAAREVYEYEYIKKYNDVFGENLNVANGKASEEIHKVLDVVKDTVIKGKLDQNYLVTPSNPTTGVASGVLWDAGVMLSKVSKTIIDKTFPIYASTGQAQAITTTAVTNFGTVISYIKDVVSKLMAIKINPDLDLPATSVLSGVRSRFVQALAEFTRYKNEQGDKLPGKQKTIIQNNINIIQATINSLRGAVISKPYGYVRGVLQETVPTMAKDAPTASALASLADNAVLAAFTFSGDSSKAPPPIVKTQSQKVEFIKEAQNGGIEGPSGAPNKAPPKLPSKSPAANTTQSPVSGTGGLARFDAKSPDQEAVAKMQLALNTFGAKIANGENKSKFPRVSDYATADGLKIIGTGPKSNPHINMFDGKWGPNTNNALSTAQKYLSSLGLNLTLGARWDQGPRTHAPDTVKVAEANASVLGRANSYIDGKSLSEMAGNDQILDYLGTPLDFAQFDMLQFHWGPNQTIPLSKADLASFTSLYAFLTKHNLKQPEESSITIESESIEGFSFKTWSQILFWFKKRARFLFEASKAADEIKPGTQKSSLNTARAYYQAISRLDDAFHKLIGFLEGKHSQHTPDSIVDWSLLNKFIPPTGSSGGKLSDLTRGDDYGPEGSGYSGRKKKHRGVFDSGAEEDKDLEGQRYKRPKNRQISDDVLPITEDYIDFNHPSWDGFDTSQLNDTTLYLDDLQLPGRQVAKDLFGGKVDMRDAEMRAVQSLGKNPAGYNERDGVLVNTGNALVPATRFLDSQEIRQRTNQILQQAPVNRYKKFLLNLSASIHDVLQSWNGRHRDKPQELKRNLQLYRNEWQRLISKQLDDLSR